MWLRIVEFHLFFLGNVEVQYSIYNYCDMLSLLKSSYCCCVRVGNAFCDGFGLLLRLVCGLWLVASIACQENDRQSKHRPTDHRPF